MNLSGQNSEHQDAVEELLRRYLLENDPETEEGESLMELASESVLSTPPLLSPSGAKGAEMIARLQKRFPAPPHPIPGQADGSSILAKGLWGFGSLAILTALVLFLTGILMQPEVSKDLNLKHLASPDLNTLADAKGEQPRAEEYTDLYGIPSLLNGGGTPVELHGDQVLGSANEKGGRKASAYRTPPTPPANYFTSPEETGPYPLTSSPTPPHATLANMEIEEPAPDPFPMRGLYAQTAENSAFYQLESDKDHLIQGKKGTLVHIPKDAFVGQSGEAVTGNVQLELKEVYNKSGYLKTNLPTVSNGKQLVSGGVIYLDATSAGRRLQLARGKEIYVEFAQQKKSSTQDMTLWEGNYNDRGEINWTPAGEENTSMVPLPPDQIYFDEFWCDCKGEKLWNRVLWELSDNYYSNTWIATREFRERLRVLRDIGYYEEGLVYYRDHTDQPLWKVDQHIAEEIKNGVGDGIGKDSDAEYFQRFAKNFKTQVIPFNDHGIDLSRWDARRQLLYRKVSKKETERLMRLYKLRQKFVAEIESRLVLITQNGARFVKNVRRGKFRKAGSVTVKGFLMKELGWHNLDKVADRNLTGVKTRKLKVRLTGAVPLDARRSPYEPVNTFLVYKNMNSMVPGSRITGQYSTFEKVPKNIDAWVVALGYDGNSPVLGIVSLPEKGRNVSVEMHKVSMDEYLAQLQAID